MKNIITLAIFIIVFNSCKQNENETETTNQIKKDTGLLKFYRDTSFSDIHVYPDTASNENLSYFFKGNKIDSTTFKLLSATATNSLTDSHDFYGVLSFKINKSCIGLITRTPGMYAPTDIRLWIYDLTKDSITNNVQLADVLGDAGTTETINSTIFITAQQQLKVLMYRYYTFDHSIDNENDKTVEVKHNYYLLNIDCAKIDTLETDSLKLNKEYKDEIKKMTRY